jgi:hypothetical protein
VPSIANAPILDSVLFGQMALKVGAASMDKIFKAERLTIFCVGSVPLQLKSRFSSEPQQPAGFQNLQADEGVNIIFWVQSRSFLFRIERLAK